MIKSNFTKGIFTFLILLLIFIGCSDDDDTGTPPNPVIEQIVAVANRGSGTVSFIDATTNQIVNTLTIENSEPMYVVYVPNTDKVYVGDRANNQVHIINPQTKEVETSITVGNGVFHMWADGQGRQLWVNNDVDNTTSVIDLATNTVIQTIDIGVKPHDVFVTNDGAKAYISIVNSDAADQVFMYNTSTFAKIGEVNVGEDPHLYHITTDNKLYVPCQSGQVYVLNGNDLSEISNTSYTGAHGIFGAPDENTIYIANIEGAQLYSINVSDNTQNGAPLDVSEATPHNLVVNANGSKLFVTHSGGTANKLTTYTINNGELSVETDITIDTNPFGLAFYSR